jgi:hypothetical protein
MMNINPFVPSAEMQNTYSRMSFDNHHSKSNHSSYSNREVGGHEKMFTMKESLVDLDSFNLSPEKIPVVMHQTFSQSFSPTLEHK